jgi:hypothetical protein
MLKEPVRVMVMAGIIFFMLTGCQKKDVEDKTPNYTPSTAGSTWTYSSNTGQSYTLTATDRDTVAMGRTYKVYSSTNGVNQYRTKQGSDYYRFGVLPVIAPAGMEELYLKDNQDVATFWQTTQTFMAPGIPIPLVATLKYTMVEKGISRTVSGKAFSDVLHVRLDVTVSNLGSVGGGDFYYANWVGLIESSLQLSAQGTQFVNSTEILTAYTIK